MLAEPQTEHQWLQRLDGEWTYASEDPAQPGVGWSGTESVRSVGDFWVMAESQGEMAGFPVTTIMSLGFDTEKQRYVGSWVNSLMSNFWVYDGGLSPDGKTLTLAAEGPDMFVDGKIGLYHHVIEFQSDEERTLSARILREDGTWHEITITRYQRTK